MTQVDNNELSICVAYSFLYMTQGWLSDDYKNVMFLKLALTMKALWYIISDQMPLFEMDD